MGLHCFTLAGGRHNEVEGGPPLVRTARLCVCGTTLALPIIDSYLVSFSPWRGKEKEEMPQIDAHDIRSGLVKICRILILPSQTSRNASRLLSCLSALLPWPFFPVHTVEMPATPCMVTSPAQRSVPVGPRTQERVPLRSQRYVVTTIRVCVCGDVSCISRSTTSDSITHCASTWRHPPPHT